MRQHALLLFSFINFFGLLLIWILQNFLGEYTGLTALLTYIPQHPFGVLSVVLICFALFSRRHKLLVLNTVSLAFFAFFLLGFQLPSPSSGSGKTVRVMTYNVLGAKADADVIASDIQAQTPDIVCLQESNHRFGERVAANFTGWQRVEGGDVTTFSRYPLLSSKIWPFRGTRRIVETRWQTPSGPLRVLNVHISTSYRNMGRDYDSRIKKVLGEARPSAMARIEQIPLVEAASAGSRQNEATVMCGDFNTPPRGLFYRALDRDWDEAFAQSGFGLGATYPRVQPLLRIDYVWMKNGAQSKRAFVPDVKGSDHLPVVCDVVLPQ